MVHVMYADASVFNPLSASYKNQSIDLLCKGNTSTSWVKLPVLNVSWKILLTERKFLRNFSVILQILNISVEQRTMGVRLLSLCTNHERVIYEVPHISVILLVSGDLWIGFQRSFIRVASWETKGIFWDPSKHLWSFLRK